MGTLLDLRPKLRVKKLYEELLAEQDQEKRKCPQWVKVKWYSKKGLWRFAKALCDSMSDEELGKLKGGLMKECRKKVGKPRLSDLT